MSLAYIYHNDCIAHDMGATHPESPLRIIAIEEDLKTSNLFDLLNHHQAPLATRSQLARVHDIKYINHVLNFQNKDKSDYLDPDTLITPKTPQAALRAAGAVILATDLVIAGKADAAFCCIRPPGHHALPDQAMGFCFFNNVAVGAAHAMEQYGFNKIAILDFDVHHGNGTEAIFPNEPRIMLCSTFQHPFYPYCGADTNSEQIINVPLSASSGSNEFREAVNNYWLPALHKFAPEMIFISAGFDAHADDYLSHLNFCDEDYTWITEQILEIADKYAEGRIVSTLEGGYELQALARSAINHIKVLMRI